MNDNTNKLTTQGVSIWYDSLSRAIIQNGELQKLISERNVVGVTTNPTIFDSAITGSDDYDLSGFTDAETAVRQLTTDDVRAACDILRPIYDATYGVNGRVSIEVDPRLAHDSAGTISAAAELYRLVNRENVMIKIPATGEGLAAITATLAQGISVNVTLIFSLTRYRAVMQAFVDGLQAAQANGLDISKIHSVASFFVSRIDSAVDPLLEQNGSEEALNLRGKIGLANSHAAYAEFKKFFAANSIWPKLTAAGAHHQRPLWASTGVKNPTYSPTLYVDSLAYPDTVNTMPPATLDALSASTDHALYPTDADLEQATANLQKLADLDISLSQIAVQLENEGVEKFIASWEDLLKNIYDKLR